MIKFVLTAFFLTAAPVLADVRLPKILGSHMVLQRNAEVTIWGWADAGEAVSVGGDWLQTPKRTKAGDDGRWRVRVQTGPAGGPHTLTISGDNTVKLDDVLFGEVWIASGQSNIEMSLIKVSGAYTGIQDTQGEVAAASHPRIRLFQAGNFSSKTPLEDVESGISMYGIPPAACKWQVCGPETVPTFSSTAYFFARELHRQLKVPIGIVDASWGGTSAETWTPTAGLQQLGLTAELKQATSLPQKSDQKIPSRLYNGMIHPLRHLKIKGFIWYQGEGNTRRADNYLALFSTMISQWRTAFGEELPFYFVQIAPFNYRGVNAALLREAQLQTLALPQTGMAVTMDIGNLTDIHPKNKQEVGRRLALRALATDYGRQVVFSGPIYKSVTFAGKQLRLTFDHAGDGLSTRDGQPVSQLEIAGDDKVFHPATAVIDGNQLIVSAENVPQPKAVRYGFTSQATPNLMNKSGLPASSFRTDRW